MYCCRGGVQTFLINTQGEQSMKIIEHQHSIQWIPSPLAVNTFAQWTPSLHAVSTFTSCSENLHFMQWTLYCPKVNMGSASLLLLIQQSVDFWYCLSNANHCIAGEYVDNQRSHTAPGKDQRSQLIAIMLRSQPGSCLVKIASCLSVQC
jgi:hypothetical protein